MKRLLVWIVILIFTGILVGCQTGPVSKQPQPEAQPALEFQEIDPLQMTPDSFLAILTFDLAKMGLLESIPNITVNPQGKSLTNETDYDAFKQRNVSILAVHEEPDGTYSQTMVVESLDDYGRIDLSRNHVVFRLRDASEDEMQASAQGFISHAKAMKAADEASWQDFRETVIDYQRSRGLASDGILGPDTAASLTEDMWVLDVQEITSHVLYPEEPRHTFHVLDCETVEKDPDKFYGGFESLEHVMDHALTPEAFKELAQPGKQFVLFVYFFDRVDPNRAINVGLSSIAKRKTKLMSPTYYAGPKKWPVLVETISIDRRLGHSRLYANLFLDKKHLSSLRLK